MIGTAPALIFDSVPWWIARPVLYALLLGTGMALDETYVNRTTVLAGALALAVHSVTSDGLWLPLSLYLDVGLVVGVYGLYAYVVDAYVPGWFRLLAFIVYSPLSVALILLFPDIIFVVSLVVAGYANVRLLATVHPVEPYYFGPNSPAESASSASETGTPEPIERPEAKPGAGLGDIVSDSEFVETIGGDSSDGDADGPSGATGTDRDRRARRRDGEPPSDRGVLPEFMRRR